MRTVRRASPVRRMMVARGADRAAIKPLECVPQMSDLSSALRAETKDEDSLSRGSLRSPLATIVGPAGPTSRGVLRAVSMTALPTAIPAFQPRLADSSNRLSGTSSHDSERNSRCRSREVWPERRLLALVQARVVGNAQPTLLSLIAARATEQSLPEWPCARSAPGPAEGLCSARAR